MSNSTAKSREEKVKLAKLLKEKSRRLARRHFYDFAKYIAPAEYNWNWHHGLLYQTMHDFAVGKLDRVIVEAPPGHGKSEACSRNLPAYLFGINPDCRVIACSYTKDLASEMNRDVQRIMDTEKYKELFPDVRLGSSSVRDDTMGKPRRNSDIFDIPGRRGFYKSAGVDGSIGGFRFDRGIIDDPIKDRAQANSAAYREACWRWFTSTFYNREWRNAGLLITSTRWHDDDLVGRIKKGIAEGAIESWTIVTLQALATDTRHPLDPRKPGEALWPWYRPVKKLEELRRLDPRDFYALQQQEPRAEGSTEWDAELFADRKLWFDDWPKNLNLLVIALDPSKGKHATHGDYSAYVILGRTPDGTLWVEADLERRNVIKIVDDGFQIINRIEQETGSEIDAFGCESDQFQELFINEFRRISQSKGLQVPMFGIATGGVAKEVRIRRLTTHFTSKNIRFRATPGTRLLVRQLEQFPNADHDDGPDALEMARRLAIRISRKK